MTICTSGVYTDAPNLALEIYQFFETKYPSIADYVVEVYHCDLTDDNVKGWQEQNGEEFLIHIDQDLCAGEYIKTLFHELVHCIQDINGLSDNNSRECEAYKLEELFYDNFMLTDASKVSL